MPVHLAGTSPLRMVECRHSRSDAHLLPMLDFDYGSEVRQMQLGEVYGH